MLSLTLVVGLLGYCSALRAADAGRKDQIDQHIKALGSKDYRIRTPAAQALGRIGKPTVKPLIAALGSRDAAIRGGAAMALGWAARYAKARPDLTEAIGPLIRLLGDKELHGRGHVPSALGAIGEPAVKPLIAALGDNDPGIRAGAATAFGVMAWTDSKLCPSLADAIGPLVALLADEDLRTRSAAGSALTRIGVPAVKAVIAALGSKNADICAGAAGAIAQMCQSTWHGSKQKALGPALTEAIRPLSGLTSDASSKVRAAAYIALAYADGKRREEILTAALQDKDPGVRARVCATARSLRQRTIWTPQGSRPLWPDKAVDSKLVDALLACLKRSGEERQYAAEALGLMGDRRAVEPLIAATKRGSESSRGAAVGALGRLGGPKALAALKALLKDPNWVVRIYSLRALAETPDPEALEALLPMLTHTSRQAHETWQIREAANEALWKMARTPRGAKAVLARIKQVREALSKQMAESSGDIIFSSGLSESMREMRNRMRVKIPKLDFANTELKDVFQLLRKVGRVNIFVDWSALAKVHVTKSTKVSVNVANVSLDRVLGLIVRDLDKSKRRIVCTAEAGALVVSTRVKLASRAGDMIEDVAEQAVFAVQADPAMRQKLAQRLPKLDFPNVPLGLVVQFLRAVSGTNIFVDWRALAEANVTKSTEVSLHVRDVSLDRVLSMIIQDVDKGRRLIGHTAVGGCIVISTREQLPKIVKGLVEDAALAARADPDMAKKLAQRLPKLDFPNVPLELVFQFLREVGGVSLYIDWRALPKADVTKKTEVSLHLVNTSLGRAFGFILADVDNGKHPLGYMVVGGCLVVSTRAELAKLSRLPADLMPPKPTRQADLEVWKKLTAKMSKVDFPNVPVKLVLEFLRDASGVPIDIDWPALEKLGVKKTTEVTVHLPDVSLAVAIQFVLIDAGGAGELGFRIAGGKVVISKAKPPKALPPPKKVPTGATDKAKSAAAAKLLVKADLYRHNKMTPQAAATYKEIIAKHPGTEAAATAKKHLDAMGPPPKGQ